MKKYGRARKIVTDGLRAYSAAMKEVGNTAAWSARESKASPNGFTNL